MAQDNQITDTEPEVNPATNEVMVPFVDTSAPVVTEEEPEVTETETPEPTPEPASESSDPFTTEAPFQQSLSQQEHQALRLRESAIANDRAALAQEKAAIEQSRLQQDQLSRYTAAYGEQAAREMLQDQQAAQSVSDAKISQLETDRIFAEEKQKGITDLSQQYNVDPNYLAKFDSRNSMEAGAIERAARIRDKDEATKANADLAKRLSALEAGKIEDGPYDSASSASSSPMTPAQLIAKSYSDPSFVMSQAQEDSVAKHLGLNT